MTFARSRRARPSRAWCALKILAHPPRTMLVTSSQAGEGKTATVVNLALSLAQQGARVLLVDADLRKPRCHHALGLPEGAGLSEYLLGETDLAAVTRTVTLPGTRNGDGQRAGHHLAFVPSGGVVQQSAELLASERMRAALAGTGQVPRRCHDEGWFALQREQHGHVPPHLPEGGEIPGGVHGQERVAARAVGDQEVE